MKISYDKTADAAYISVKKGAVKKTVKLASLINADLDKNGRVIGVEILNVSFKFPKNNGRSVINIPLSIIA
jgi:uncharacterized protein YuzE